MQTFILYISEQDIERIKKVLDVTLRAGGLSALHDVGEIWNVLMKATPVPPPREDDKVA